MLFLWFLNLLIPPLPSYWRGRTIRDTLVKSDQYSMSTPRVTFLGPKNTGSFPCLCCIQCSCIIKGKGFPHPLGGYNIPIRDYYTCQSSYVVYIIKCPCGLLYVGETTQKVKDRIARHKYSIRAKQGQTSFGLTFCWARTYSVTAKIHGDRRYF